MKTESRIQIRIMDDGVRQQVWKQAADKQGLSQQAWAARVLDKAAKRQVGIQIPPLLPPGRPRKNS